MKTQNIPEAIFAIVIGSLADEDGRLGEGVYEKVSKSLTYFTWFEDCDIVSDSTKHKITQSLLENGKHPFIGSLAQLLPDHEDSPLREQAFLLASYFMFSPLGDPATRDVENNLLIADLDIKIGAGNLVTCVYPN
jgi:hypothetical protein